MNQEWNAEKYVSDFSFVSGYGNDVAELIDKENVKSVLDLGCGNGTLTDMLGKKGFKVTGIDSSAEMIEAARAKYPDIDFICGDAADFSLQDSVDAVFSNAVFHWINKERQPNMMECVYRVLNSGGQFVFEMGGVGNNKRIHSALAKAFESAGMEYTMPFYFPSVGEYSSMLESVGFKVRYAALFDRPTVLKGENGLRDWINMFINIPFSGVDEKARSGIIGRAVETLSNDLLKDGIWYADYVRLRMKAVKE